ncbi:MAG: FadR family transcriptional regulator [Maledivibacter sp.]|nr:FadR family transcriptional regulator [Maledivibacter sp.]
MIERTLLHDMIVKEMKKIIKESDLQNGDKLPTQGELVKKFGVSRTSLREALRTLQALNIIEVINGKGMYVKSNSFIFQHEDGDEDNKKQHLLHVLDVRRALEFLSVELAVENATEEDINDMERNVRIMEEKAKKGEPHPKYDKAFHYAIYKASKNPVLINTINYLHDQFEVLWENPLGAGDALTEGTAYHVQLFKAIKDKNLKVAEEAFNKLIDQVEVIIKNI